MALHHEIPEFDTWQQRADAEEQRAREHARVGDFNTACRAAQQAGEYAITGMIRGIWWWVQGYDRERWGPAFETAFATAHARRVNRPLHRVLTEDCSTSHPPRHDAIDAADALADMVRVRLLAETVWRVYTDELDRSHQPATNDAC